MKQQMILTLVAGLVGGALGAALLGTVLSAPSSEPTGTVGLALVEERLDDLARQNEQLREQIGRIEDRPLMTAPVRTDVEPEALPSPEEDRIVEMLEDLQRSNGKTESLPENFKLQVSSALEQIRAEEEAKREKQREEARLERRERQLQQLAEKLGMDAYQTNEMRVTLAKQEEAMQKARETIRDSGDWTSMRDTMRTVREETIRSVSLFLTPTQVAQFEESANDFGFRGGDRAGRGGRGGGGGRNAGG
jgi:hypothetical protein